MTKADKNHEILILGDDTMPENLSVHNLFSEVSGLIEQAKRRVATRINRDQTLLNWHIGQSVHRDLLKEQRAVYGKQIVSTLSRQLQNVYGKGYSRQNLFRMIQFFGQFPDSEKVSTLSTQLSWSHFVELLIIKDDLKRDFYVQMAMTDNWSVRVLRERIDSMLFERTAISSQPEETIVNELEQLAKTGELSPDLVFKDPYMFDFLGLKGAYDERDLESAILREIEQFLLELGGGFTFIERQKRMIIDGEDHYLDLLFYHRKLRSLIAIELKMGRFKAAYKGQMELYLRWLEKYEQEDFEEAPLGLILCAEASQEKVELLQLDKSGIHVAEYLTQLPDRKLLEEKLHSSMINARKRLGQSSKDDNE